MKASKYTYKGGRRGEKNVSIDVYSKKKKKVDRMKISEA
jgi:hypothetical protein